MGRNASMLQDQAEILASGRNMKDSLLTQIGETAIMTEDAGLYDESNLLATTGGKAQRFAAHSKIWLLPVLRLMPFVLRTNFRMSIKSWGLQNKKA